MSFERRVLPSVALAALSLLPLPALGQGEVGPLQRIQTFTGFRGSGVTSSTHAGSLAFFTVKGPYTFQSLWRSDGTVPGTFQIGPRNPITPQTALRFWASHGDLALFTWALDAAPDDRGLWRSDGTDSGTFPLTEGLSFAVDTGSETFSTSLSVPGRGLAFFSAGPRSESPDFELWATDGSVAGTRLVADVNPDGPSNPRFMTMFGDRLFFLTDTPQGPELWRSDGTTEGTVRVQDFHASGDAVVTLRATGGALFILLSKAPGVEVWRSDGTESGTTRALDLPLLDLQRSALAGGKLFLNGRVAGLPEDKEIWVIDGATGGAVRVLQVETSLDNLEISAAGNGVFFRVIDDRGLEPWWSDGTLEGTHRIADLCPGACGSIPQFLGTYGGRAVLAVRDAAGHGKPWLTNGSAAGTYPLGDLCADGDCSSLIGSLEINGWLLLLGADALWVSDGSRDGAWRAGYMQGVIDVIPLPGRALFATMEPSLLGGVIGSLWSLPATVPPTPPGDWLASGRVPGFLFKIRIAGTIPGRPEPECIAETLCASGALPGRSEVFVRVVGPRPNGYLWPTLVRFTPFAVEVWIKQVKTGTLRYYRLDELPPGSTDLSGRIDKKGFQP